MKRFFFSTVLLLLAGWSVAATTDEDGSRLWLRLDAVNTNAITLPQLMKTAADCGYASTLSTPMPLRV